MLAELFSFFHNPLMQFTDILDLLANSLLHNLPHCKSTEFRSGLLGGHSVGGMKSGVICFSSWTVSLAQ